MWVLSIIYSLSPYLAKKHWENVEHFQGINDDMDTGNKEALQNADMRSRRRYAGENIKSIRRISETKQWLNKRNNISPRKAEDLVSPINRPEYYSYRDSLPGSPK